MRRGFSLFIVLCFILSAQLSCSTAPTGDPGPETNRPATGVEAVEDFREATRDAINGAGAPETVFRSTESAITAIFNSTSSTHDAIQMVYEIVASAITSEEDLIAYDDFSRSVGGQVSDFDPALLDSTVLQAQRRDEDCPTTVFFVNGMNVTIDAFAVSVAALRKLVDQVLPRAYVMSYYNTSATDADFSIFGGRICPLFGGAADKCREIGGFLVDLAQATEQEAAQWGQLGRLGQDAGPAHIKLLSP